VAGCKLVIGLDYDLLSLVDNDIIENLLRGDILSLPVRSGSVDLVTANMVVEHLPNPVAQFMEISRVLKPGGLFLFHTPNRLGYNTVMAKMIPEGLKPLLIRILQSRDEEDVFETHYRVNSEDQVSETARRAVLEVQDVRLINSALQFLIVPPLALLESLWVKLLMGKNMRRYRTNIIAILRKGYPGDSVDHQ